jgi:NAD(P)-dependent dehydrogenase (short-subunit alcohol dehydrogenase family)
MKTNESFVIITGACGGIGRELVRTFHGEGFRVIAIDTRKSIEFPSGVNFLEYDVSSINEDQESRLAIKREINNLIEGNQLIALINNAAVQIVKEIREITYLDWKQTLDVNLLAPFFWSQMFLDALESSRGSILNISSIHARQTKKKFAVYATSKAGLSSLTRLMAIELGDRVRVNAIEPGAISTQMLEEGFRENPLDRDRLDSIQPMGRIGQPIEVAQLAVFLTSEKARFINGSSIAIDGGIGNQLHDPI